MPNKQSWRTEKHTTAERGYGHRWQESRAVFLANHPMCEMCKAEGRLTVATVVDHIKPHRGDEALFWDVSNWQSICAPHHNSDKQAIERGGRVKRRINLDGWPEGY